MSRVFLRDFTQVKIGSYSTNIINITSTEIKVQVPSNIPKGAMKISVAIEGKITVSETDFTIE